MHLYLNIGSNIEPRISYLEKASWLIAEMAHCKIIGSSHIYETQATGLAKDSPPFLNMCIGIRTRLKVEDLLEKTQNIEIKLGRPESSKGKHVSRIIDIDILLAEGLILDKPGLKIPHPGITSRSFFLWPLIEIYPSATDPRNKKPLKYLLMSNLNPPILRTFPGFDLCSQNVSKIRSKKTSGRAAQKQEKP